MNLDVAELFNKVLRVLFRLYQIHIKKERVWILISLSWKCISEVNMFNKASEKQLMDFIDQGS